MPFLALSANRVRTLVAATISVTLLAISACHREDKTTAPTLQTVQAGRVILVQPAIPQRYSATTLPNEQVDLAFKSPGIVQSLHQTRGADGRVRDIEAGDRVMQGTQLAVVRPLDYQQRVDQGDAGVRQAEAQLAGAKAGFANAELGYTRAQNLYRSASLIKPDYDQAEAQFKSARAQVEAAQSAVDNARAQLSEARLSLSDTSITAPFTGYVVARNVSRGSLAGNTSPAFTLIDTHVVKAVFAVPDTSLRSIRLGRRLPITLDAVDHPIQGTITAIAPQADAKSRVFSVEITIPNATNTVRPGMIGSLTLEPGPQLAARLVVPLGAVVRASGNPNGFSVFRIDNRDGRTYAAAQPVQVGSTFGNNIEVVSGLTQWESIIILGGELLRDGQEVRVLP